MRSSETSHIVKFVGLSCLCFVLVGCGLFECGNTTTAEAISPDGKYVATAFIRDCGATTSWSPQVHLRRVGEPLAEIGNVFIGYGACKTHQLAWLSATQLVVFSDCEEVRQLTNYHAVVVEKRGTTFAPER